MSRRVQRAWRRSTSGGLAVLVISIFMPAAPLNSQTATRTQSHPQSHAHSATDPAASAVPVKSIGDRNAPITVEVFSDYQCPACRHFYEETLRPMINDYVASGKVYLVHRDFPLQMHPYSYQAARWENAAAKIGKFQDVDAALFDNQVLWSGNGDVEKYIAGAMNPAEYKRVQKIMEGCVASAAPSVQPASSFTSPQTSHGCSVDTYIEADKNLGKAVPVTQTPTIIISYKGQKYPASSGIITWPILKQYFDSLLQQ